MSDKLIVNQPVLLWQNSIQAGYPFGPTTINLDLSRYKYVCIIFEHWADNTIKTPIYYPILQGSIQYISWAYNTIGITGGRSVTISSTNIIFGTGYANDGTANNFSCIPRFVYGIG